MLRISKLADYGTIIMVYLARKAPMLCNAREIANDTHVNLPTVSKLLKRLTAAGLLTSVRGMAGGYKLQRFADAISVGDIIYALEEQHGLTECSVDGGGCALQGICHVEDNWQVLSRAIDSALHSVSLEALSKPTLSAVDVGRVKQVVMGVNRGYK
jgi:FeS assembly SUF system regulator